MSYGNFAQGQNTMAMNPPPPPPIGLTMMASAGPQITNGFDAAQMQMMQNSGQPQMAGQQAMQQQLQQMQQMQQQMQQMQQMQQQMMHPALNDAPLEFNMAKNKPPPPAPNEDSKEMEENNTQAKSGREERGNDRRDHRDRDRRDRDRDRRDRGGRDRSSRDVKDDQKDRSREDANKQKAVAAEVVTTPPNQAVANQMQAMNSMMGMNPMMGMMGGMMGPMMPMMGSMLSDPSMLGMTGLGQVGQYGMMPGMMSDGSLMPSAESTMVDSSAMGGLVPGQKGMIECKDCTLIPPSPNAPAPITRTRPPGCKTVYIGGIPENCTEDIIRDVFGRCGEMQTVRLSKKNFCHIRFVYEQSVDAAIFLSGYRMRIGNNTDAPNTGRLHVDFAQARDDQYEYECRQRALQREQRHRERMERERMRPPSPPPIPHYSDHEAAAVGEKIKTDEGFQKSVHVVVTWLERGDCSKRNANNFYSMIQSTNSHVRRLMNEKMQFEEELQSARDLHRTRVQGITVQFDLIEKVFNCASHKKCWDHFTKAQRKNIETWKKQTTEIKILQFSDTLNEEAEEEMDVSDVDDEYPGLRKKARSDKDAEMNVLKDENESLRCQLEAYKNEVDLVRGDLKGDLDSKDKQLKVLQQTVQNLQKQLLDSKRRQVQDEVKVKQMEATIKTMNAAKTKAADAKDPEKTAEEEDGKEGKEGKEEGETETAEAHPLGGAAMGDREARLVGLISTFLHVHPFGAGVDYVWSYLTKLDPVIRTSEVEQILSRYPTIFRQELSGIGASLERRWAFVGFETV